MKFSGPISVTLALVGAAPGVLSSELRGVDVATAATKCDSDQYDYRGICRDDPENRPTCYPDDFSDGTGRDATHICSRPKTNWWACDKGAYACDGGPPLGRHGCEDCLKHGYSWSPVEGCILSCAEGDASCYSSAYGNTPTDCPRRFTRRFTNPPRRCKPFPCTGRWGNTRVTIQKRCCGRGNRCNRRVFCKNVDPSEFGFPDDEDDYYPPDSEDYDDATDSADFESTDFEDDADTTDPADFDPALNLAHDLKTKKNLRD